MTNDKASCHGQGKKMIKNENDKALEKEMLKVAFGRWNDRSLRGLTLKSPNGGHKEWMDDLGNLDPRNNKVIYHEKKARAKEFIFFCFRKVKGEVSWEMISTRKCFLTKRG